MEENYGIGYRPFVRFSEFVGDHTPKPIMDAVERTIRDPHLPEKMKVATYGLMATTGGVAAYGAIADRPVLLAAGVVGTAMTGLVEIVRRRVASATIDSRVNSRTE